MRTEIAEARRRRREAIAQDVLAHYRSGKSVDEIAWSMRAARLSVGQIRGFLREAGVSIRAEKRALAKQLVEMYQEGLRIAEIAARCAVPRQAVRAALKARGVAIDDRDRKVASIIRTDVELIKSLYESGATMEDIGRMVKLPISRERVRQLLSKGRVVTGGIGRKDDPVVFMATLRNSKTCTWRELATATSGNVSRAQVLASSLGVFDAATRLLRVRRVLRARRMSRPSVNALQLPVDEMRAMRADGKTWPEIARFAGCSVASARLYVSPDGSGDARARTGQEKMPLPLDEMREMRARGFRDGEIAKRVGCSIGTIRNRIGLRKPTKKAQFAVERWRTQRDRLRRGRRVANVALRGMTYNHAREAHARACKAAETKNGYTLHSARHSFAVQLRQEGVPFELIASNLGHKDTSEVQKCYGRFTVDVDQWAIWEGRIERNAADERAHVRGLK